MRLKLMLSAFLGLLFSFIIIMIIITESEPTIPDITYTHVGKLERIEQLSFKPVAIKNENNQDTLIAHNTSGSIVSDKQTKLTSSRNAELSTSKVFTVTAYDLSVQSCGKPIGHPHYGLTASSFNLTGLSREDAMSIAVDTQIIPMGSQVKVTFIDESYAQYNGVYTARDTGGAIKGYKIDLFMGDFQQNEASQEAINFGTPKAEVVVLQ